MSPPSSSVMQTPAGHAIPPAPRHSITLHLPGWSNLARWAEGDPEVVASIKSMYPRLMLHRDVKTLSYEIWQFAGSPPGIACLIFSNSGYAAECKEYATSINRNESRLSPSEVTIRTFTVRGDDPDFPIVSLHVVFFPESKRSIVQPFWTHTGTGISSRLAEHCLRAIETIMEEKHLSNSVFATPQVNAHDIVRRRIADLLKRDMSGPLPIEPISPDDVYLFPTGMAAVYHVHKCIRQSLQGIDAIVGFPFKSTYVLSEAFGLGVKLFDSATSLESEFAADCQNRLSTRIHAIWTEIPANPLLTTADLIHLRQIADRHGIPLIVDDTIGSFCNIDVLGVADILITSLTKSFSGYADVMAGCIVINSASPKYKHLRTIAQREYCNDYWGRDVETLERNSRDYLLRSRILNRNASQLVSHLEEHMRDDASVVSKVFYPTTSPDRKHYERFLRPATNAFTPGYGCLFTIEFRNINATVAFYDSLAAYNGPHLGAHLTLAFPYVRGLYAKQLNWVGQYGLRENQIRISVGLEDFELLQQRFDAALEVANATKKS